MGLNVIGLSAMSSTVEEETLIWLNKISLITLGLGSALIVEDLRRALQEHKALMIALTQCPMQLALESQVRELISVKEKSSGE